MRINFTHRWPITERNPHPRTEAQQNISPHRNWHPNKQQTVILARVNQLDIPSAMTDNTFIIVFIVRRQADMCDSRAARVALSVLCKSCIYIYSNVQRSCIFSLTSTAFRCSFTVSSSICEEKIKKKYCKNIYVDPTGKQWNDSQSVFSRPIACFFDNRTVAKRFFLFLFRTLAIHNDRNNNNNRIIIRLPEKWRRVGQKTIEKKWKTAAVTTTMTTTTTMTLECRTPHTKLTIESKTKQSEKRKKNRRQKNNKTQIAFTFISLNTIFGQLFRCLYKFVGWFSVGFQFDLRRFVININWCIHSNEGYWLNRFAAGPKRYVIVNNLSV